MMTSLATLCGSKCRPTAKDRRARGSFNVVHLDDAGGLYARSGRRDLPVRRRRCRLPTGIIRQPWLRECPDLDLQGTAAAITVADGGTTTDVLGFDFQFSEARSTLRVSGVEPILPVDSGNFTVR